MAHLTAHHGADGSKQPTGLFRPEVPAAKRGESLGTIQLAASLSGWALGTVVLELRIAEITLLTFIEKGGADTVMSEKFYAIKRWARASISPAGRNKQAHVHRTKLRKDDSHSAHHACHKYR